MIKQASEVWLTRKYIDNQLKRRSKGRKTLSKQLLNSLNKSKMDLNIILKSI